MELALLLLTLLPLAFLPEFDMDEDDEAGGSEMPEFAGGLTDPLAPLIADDVLDPDATDPEGEILQPQEDTADEPTFDPVSGDPLVPVDTIDTLDGTIQLDFEDVTGAGYAEIQNFDASADVLEVYIEAGSVQGALDVDVVPSPDGQDAMVYVEGQLLAVLKSAATASAANVVAFIERP